MPSALQQLSWTAARVRSTDRGSGASSGDSATRMFRPRSASSTRCRRWDTRAASTKAGGDEGGGGGEKREGGHGRDEGEDDEETGGHEQHRGLEPRGEARGRLALAVDPSDEHPGAEADEKRRDLSEQAVPDGEAAVDVEGATDVEVVAQHTDRDAAGEVDRGNRQAGDRIALHEPDGTVHGPVEVRHLGEPSATTGSLGRGDDTGAQIGLDRSLATRQGIEGKASADLRDPLRAAGDDDGTERS